MLSITFKDSPGYLSGIRKLISGKVMNLISFNKNVICFSLKVSNNSSGCTSKINKIGNNFWQVGGTSSTCNY
jgi:hypothetical protein